MKLPSLINTESFQDPYYMTYVDVCSPKMTRFQTNFLCQYALQGTHILDVACGYGRHSIALAKHWYSVTGIDTSETLLQKARTTAQSEGAQVSFLHQDVRTMTFVDEFDTAISMFTSFGYFTTETDNVLFFQNIYNAIRTGGIFVLDLWNAIDAVTHAVQNGEMNEDGDLCLSRVNSLSNGLQVTLETVYDIKTLWVHQKQSWESEGQEFTDSVYYRLFLHHDIVAWAQQVGFDLVRVYGGYDASPYQAGSKRMIFLFQK